MSSPTILRCRSRVIALFVAHSFEAAVVASEPAAFAVVAIALVLVGEL